METENIFQNENQLSKIIKKVEFLINKVNQNMHERKEVIKFAFLALLSGESLFLLGSPGVAKSMIARRMKYTIKGGSEFEYLMNRFSTPEEIFGPISLSKLEEDKYERVVKGYLPNSDIAFLDEIWKASPSIQNTLLTIINERIFRNGDKDIQVPLKLLISASNELPAEDEGLEALYDRFLIRYSVEPVQRSENFKKLLTMTTKPLAIDETMKLDLVELELIKQGAGNVYVSNLVLNFIIDLRKQFAVQLKEKAPYISDRRWRKIVWLLKVSAFISQRDKIEAVDLLIIKHTIWENEDQKIGINKIFDQQWTNFLTTGSGVKLKDIDSLSKNGEQILKKASFMVKEQVTREISGYTYYRFEEVSKAWNYYLPFYDQTSLEEYRLNHKDNFRFFYTTSFASKPNLASLDEKVGEYDNFPFPMTISTFRQPHSFAPMLEDVKKYNYQKLKEIKPICAKMDDFISLTRFHLENIQNKKMTKSSIIVQEYSNKFETAIATIKDQLNQLEWNSNYMVTTIMDIRNQWIK